MSRTIGSMSDSLHADVRERAPEVDELLDRLADLARHRCEPLEDASPPAAEDRLEADERPLA
jgi:hypothetical protein